jgi:AcrR family transcriptional regulator
MNNDYGGQAIHGANGMPGLRERKKLATRQALSAAAIRLALEQGFDNVRVEDIAEAAGVSPRTFNNYFSSREEAIVAARTSQVERMAEALRARPAEESLLEALSNAMTAEHDHPREPMRDVVRLFICHPTLHAEFMRSAAQTSSPMIEAVADRTDTSPDDLLPQVVTSAAFGALRAAMHKWLGDEASPPFQDLLRDALNQLRVLAGNPDASAPERADRGEFVTTRAAPEDPPSGESAVDSLSDADTHRAAA